jgi:vacuolar protein sorting-associated protein 72
VITGLPAKYRDPQTGAPYATLDAFRTIRGRGRSRSQSFGGGPAGAEALRAQIAQ